MRWLWNSSGSAAPPSEWPAGARSLRTARRVGLAAVVITSLLLPTSDSHAQTPAADSTTSFQVEQFEPVPSVGLNIMSVSTSRMLPQWEPSFGLTMYFVDDPLTVHRVRGDQVLVSRLIDYQLKGELTLGIGITGWLDIGLAIPLTFVQAGEDLALAGRPGASISGFAMNDVRIVAKGRILDPESYDGLGLHIAVPFYVPSGDTSAFATDNDIRLRPTIGADWQDPASPFVLAVNLGYQLRPARASHNFVSGSGFHWSVGMEIPSVVLEDLTILATAFGHIQSETNRDPFALEQQDTSVEDAARTDNPIEAQVGFRYRFNSSWSANLAAGFGITGDVGAPAFRGILGIGFAPSEQDKDRDGVVDSLDECPTVPEDLDSFQDGDGCPDPDNDNDGIPDVSDGKVPPDGRFGECRDRPEDMDGTDDEDGCPDEDNDNDNVKDKDDACPNVPEDDDGWDSLDGCPDLDNDADGIPDVDDGEKDETGFGVCKDMPEDKDGFQDADGCPDDDNDGDGVPDATDKCPDTPQTAGGFDGCPEVKPADGE